MRLVRNETANAEMLLLLLCHSYNVLDYNPECSNQCTISSFFL